MWVFLLSPIPQQLCFWQTASIPPSPQNQSPSGNSGDKALPRDEKGLHAWDRQSRQTSASPPSAMVHCLSPAVLGQRRGTGGHKAKQGLSLAWGISGYCWGWGFGTLTRGRVGRLSPPGIVIQRSFPLLQGQVSLHRGLCKLLCSWLEQKAQEPSGDSQTKPGDLLSGSARTQHANSVSSLKCSIPLTPWLVLNTDPHALAASHQTRGDNTTTRSTLEEGTAMEPWMPEAAAAWEVDGAGRSVPASLLSGKKGTLPSSKLAMVVSTQLVWAVGTKRIC